MSAHPMTQDLIPRAAVEAAVENLRDAFGRDAAKAEDAGQSATVLGCCNAMRALELALTTIRSIPPAPEGEGLREALEKLLTLTKVELRGTGNAEKQPWKRNIERCEAALARTAHPTTEEKD